jgi:hypothetical protein
MNDKIGKKGTEEPISISLLVFSILIDDGNQSGHIN